MMSPSNRLNSEHLDSWFQVFSAFLQTNETEKQNTQNTHFWEMLSFHYTLKLFN